MPLPTGKYMLEKLPQRKILPHEIPSWVKQGTLYFITICGLPRGYNQFCRREIGENIMASAQLYHDQFKWWVHLFILMPDHIHGLIAFPRDKSIKKLIGAWKGYLTKQNGICWQRDFFDHRLRKEESIEEKVFYIRHNPVRAGLIDRYEDWPYVLETR